MKQNNLLKGYDDLLEGKKIVRIMILGILLFSLLVVLTTLFLSYKLNAKATDTIKVIDSNGRIIPSEVKRQEDVFHASIQAHLANCLYYLNTFDRNSIKENQARALFLVDKKSADRIFNSFTNTGAYNDAIRNGYIYKSKFIKLAYVNKNREPFEVEFEGELNIIDKDRTIKYRITGKGKVRYNTPSYPYNVQGMILYDYLQNFEEIKETN